MHTRLIILGSGPAGFTAAIYAARANLSPIVIAGSQSGGQLMITTDVENYPGFPEGVQGPELMEKFRKQAERFGADIIDKDVTEVNFKVRPFVIRVGNDTYTSDSVIISTGAQAKWIGLDSELRLRGRGVSACATCDAFFFKGKDVAVVGGGDTAMEESNFLSKFVNHVTVIHRRDKLRASKIMQEKAKANPKISFVWNSAVSNVLGEKNVEGVMVRNLETGEAVRLPVKGLFVAIGHEPNTALFQGQIETHNGGYIKVHDRTKTNIDGVFAAGDVVDFRYRQAVTAAGMGCEASLDAERYLEEQASKELRPLKIAG
ncbi:MAG: thioredoxin-disulfide reductase [Nitrososphaerales archaeon]